MPAFDFSLFTFHFTVDFNGFLKELLPSWGLNPGAFSRRNLERKVSLRLKATGERSFKGYLARVRAEAQEAGLLYQLFTVTISRFFRDYFLFRALFEKYLMPALGRGVKFNAPAYRAWCAGCAAGEEAYTLSILWQEYFATEKIGALNLTPPLEIRATDLRDDELERARRGWYKTSSLKEVPPTILHRYFEPEKQGYRLREEVKKNVIFQRHDLLKEPPLSGINLILCRNLAFTYFSPPAQERVGETLWRALLPGGFLFLGKKEKLPEKVKSLFSVVDEEFRIYGK